MALQLAQLAVVLALVFSIGSLTAGRRMAVHRHLLLPLLGLSGILAGIAGFRLLLDGGVQATTLPVGLPWLPMQLSLDRLAAFFLLLVGVLVLPVALYARGYLREFEHGSDSPGTLGFFTGLFVAGMYLVVLAADAFGFMVAWELMSLSSYFLVAFQHEQAANRRASFLYLLMAHLGALCILLAFGVLAMQGEGFSFAAMRLAHPGLLWSSVAFALALAGFGMKAGLFPFHAWLPEAHPVAPSHISALMSGVMLKVALY
ncbi:MAG: hydrogenase 4 subunit B, partial [Gammaproteobacteria bacterium]